MKEALLPERKHPRLKNYDYSQNGCYFVTLCTRNRANILGKICVGRDVIIPPITELSEYGEIVDLHIRQLSIYYESIKIPKYVVMPNHVHIIVNIDTADSGGLRTARPTVQTMVRSFKTFITRKIGSSIWQDSFYEHIVRNEEDYLRIWKYIDENPAKWGEDKYYIE